MTLAASLPDLRGLPTVGLPRVKASLSGFKVQGGGPAAVITLPLLEWKDVPSQDRSD